MSARACVCLRTPVRVWLAMDLRAARLAHTFLEDAEKAARVCQISLGRPAECRGGASMAIRTRPRGHARIWVHVRSVCLISLPTYARRPQCASPTLPIVLDHGRVTLPGGLMPYALRPGHIPVQPPLPKLASVHSTPRRRITVRDLLPDAVPVKGRTRNVCNTYTHTCIHACINSHTQSPTHTNTHTRARARTYAPNRTRSDSHQSYYDSHLCQSAATQ